MPARPAPLSGDDPDLSSDLSSEVSRRSLIRAGGGLAIAGYGAQMTTPLAGSRIFAQSSGAPRETAARVTVALHEGTNMCVALSPDRRTVAMDLVGMVWILPLDGGDARLVTDSLSDATQPDWSPDGRTIAFQSYHDGNYHLWRVNHDGTGLRKLTSGPYDHREPRFSPDGQLLAFSSDLDGGYGTYVLDLHTLEITAWAERAGEEGAPAWSPDGTTLAITVDGTAIDAVGRSGGRRRLVSVKNAQVGAPSWSPNGKDVAYSVIQGVQTKLVVGDRTVSREGEDVFPFRVAWLATDEILYTADGRIRRLNLGTGETRDVGFTAEVSAARRKPLPRRGDLGVPGPRPVRGIVGPALSPSGDRVAFCALGDLWVMRVGGRAERLTKDGFFTTDPAWSPDGRYLSYTSDQAGTPDLWIRDLRTGDNRRLTALPYAAVAGAWSPDGTRIAFQDQDGATYVIQVDSGDVKLVLQPLLEPGRPSWSPDGNILAFAALKPYSRRYREGTNQILTLDLRTGAVAYAEPEQFRSISSRGHDGPVWSPDGKRMALIMGGALWVLPVDQAGKPVGSPRQVTDEVADSPSWSGDSSTLLYLSKGRLRTVNADGGAPRTVPLPLTWSAATPRGRTVIHAGKMWDGRSRQIRENVDIVIENDRIVEVRPHQNGGVAGARKIDASQLTVLPGMMDMHVHAHMRSSSFGSRQGRLWLALGITSIRSPGDPAYRAIEEREAVAAGARLGPRYFASGEAIDGSRVYYGFMRATASDADLAREIERALALDYDVIKAYVRLSAPRQRTVIDAAHRKGTWVTSHYLFPAVSLGIDGMEHIGSTNRLGYSQTVSGAARSYQDVVALLSSSGVTHTPTLFTGAALYAEDDSLVNDRRVRTLYPAREYAALKQKANLIRTSPGTARLYADALVAHVQTVKRIHDAGGFIITGTDSPIDSPAVSLHLNLRGMVAHGMTPNDALVTATRNAATALGVADRLGTIESGKLADLVCVEGDPLKDIAAAANVRMVITGGVPHDVDELLAPFEGKSASDTHASTANRELPPLANPASNKKYWWHDTSHNGPAHFCC